MSEFPLDSFCILLGRSRGVVEHIEDLALKAVLRLVSRVFGV